MLYVTLPLKGVSGGMYNITIQNVDGVNVSANDIFYVTDQARLSSAPGVAGRSPVVQKPNVPMTRGLPSMEINPIKRPVVRGGGGLQCQGKISNSLDKLMHLLSAYFLFFFNIFE